MTSRWRTCQKITACKRKYTRYEIHVNMIFTDSSSSSFESMNLTGRSSNELENLHVSRFPSDLVHRLIILLTLLFLEKMMIISPDNTL